MRTPILVVLALALAASGVAATLARATQPAKTNGLIAFQTSNRIWVVARDGSGLRKLSTEKGPHVEDSDADWSPDASSVAFSHCDGTCEVWTIHADGTGLKSVGPAGHDIGEPAWSPDGRRIADSRFWNCCQHDIPRFSEIYVMNRNGSGAHRLTSVTLKAPYSAALDYPSWSPNGRQIVFAVTNSKTADPPQGRALFIVDAAGGEPRQLTPWELNAGGKSDWSPDGKLILFRAISTAHREHGNLHTIRPDGTGLKRLTNYPEPKTINAGSFSPDGKWIVFSRFTKTPYPDLYVMRSDGSGVRAIGTGKSAFTPDWGPAG